MEPTEVIYMGEYAQECCSCGCVTRNVVETTDGDIYCEVCWEEELAE